MGIIDTDYTVIVNTHLFLLEERMKKITKGDFSFSAKFKKDTDVVIVTVDKYFQYQDKGVSGTKRKVPGSPYKYGNKMPPPSSFSKYTSDKGVQFAIAKSIQKEGFNAKNYIEKIHNDKEIQRIFESMYAALVEQNEIAWMKKNLKNAKFS
jgi:hypothetical protein